MAGFFDEQNGGLVTYWRTVSAITSRVGTRILRDVAKTKWTGQFLLYTRGPGGAVYQHLTGTSGARTSLVHVYAWGDTATDADALMEAVKTASHSGFERKTWNGIYVNRCLVDEPQDDGYDFPVDGSDAKRFWSRLVLRITHSESGGT